LPADDYIAATPTQMPTISLPTRHCLLMRR